ncbi:3334_t:CDS:2 [Rhizophagus irregularis]|nr:3334_t:CDS:2 [Rhizophagus irregularis]
MLQPVELPIVINEPKYECEIESETSKGDESDIPAALNEVFVIMKHSSAKILDSDYSNLMFNEGRFQLKRINEKPNNLSIINGGDSAYSNHCFANEPIITLDDVSYILLHVYISIHLDLFSDIVQEGCYILTYHLAFNIFIIFYRLAF